MVNEQIRMTNDRNVKSLKRRTEHGIVILSEAKNL